MSYMQIAKQRAIPKTIKMGPIPSLLGILGLDLRLFEHPMIPERGTMVKRWRVMWDYKSRSSVSVIYVETVLINQMRLLINISRWATHRRMPVRPSLFKLWTSPALQIVQEWNCRLCPGLNCTMSGNWRLPPLRWISDTENIFLNTPLSPLSRVLRKKFPPAQLFYSLLNLTHLHAGSPSVTFSFAFLFLSATGAKRRNLI